MLSRLPEASSRRADLWYTLGKVAQVRQDHAAAERFYLQARREFESAGDRQGVSRCHNGLGMVAQARAENARAEPSYTQAEHAAFLEAEHPAAFPDARHPAAHQVAQQATRHTPAVPLPGAAATAPAVAARAGTAGRPRRTAHRWRLPIVAALAVAMLVLAVVQLAGALTSSAPGRQPPGAGGHAASAPSPGTSADGHAVRPGSTSAPPPGTAGPGSITGPHDSPVSAATSAPPGAAAQPTGNCPGQGLHHGWQHAHHPGCDASQTPSPSPSASA